MSFGQTLLVNDHTEVSFSASAPIGAIHGASEPAHSSINLQTGEINVVAENTSFEFAQKFMRKRFNQDIMESKKFPLSEFKGIVHDAEELRLPGEHKVYVDGILKIHGVEKPYHTYALITVNGNTLKTYATSKVKSADPRIKPPSFLMVKFAEEMDVTISGTYNCHPS